MKKKLEDLSEVSLGTILTRVKPKYKFDETIDMETISMQEVNYVSGRSNKETAQTTSKVLKSSVDKCLMTCVNDVIICLSSQNAMVISKKEKDKLILSNFCLVRINDQNILNSYYLAWLINESKIIKRQLAMHSQGNAFVKILSLEAIRNIMIDLPSIKQQNTMGVIYKLELEKRRISSQIIDLNTQVVNYKLESIIKNS